MCRTLYSSILAGLLCAGSAQAGSFFFDFNEDPVASGDMTITGSGYWNAVDGVGYATNASDGYLNLSYATGQSTRIIFSDFDTGSVVQAFTFEADLRIGNGSEAPADGFSVNYCRANDPVLTGGAFATGQNCEANLPEEGTQTGIGIGFDAWNSGGTAGALCNVVDQSIGTDVPAVTVRVDGILVKQYATPTANGGCADASSIQTGPYTGDGSTAGLCWAHLKVQLAADGKLNVWWKGTQILTDYQTTYFPSAGRLVFAGRTGGSWQNQHVDNISISTVAATVAQVGSATGLPDGFSIGMTDSGSSVVTPATAEATATLDGTSVAPLTGSKNGADTTFTYRGFPMLLTPGSTHEVVFACKDGNGNPVTATRSFTVPNYPTIPAADAVTGVDTSKVGFKVMPWQSGEQNNTTIYTLEQLLGYHGANEADLTSATNGGYINITDPLNYNINPVSNGGGDAGNFQTGNGYPDSLFPGIPGANTLNGSTALKVLTYLEFTTAGVYEMIVNSDDGFLVTEGKNADDWFALKLGEYNGGKGSSDVSFYVAVPTAGIYPVRLLWENGNGELPGNGANLEWLTVKDGVKYLVNDAAATNVSGVKAYYAGPAPAYVQIVQPYAGATGLWPTNCGGILMDGSTTVDGSSIKLYLNGVEAPSPAIFKSGLATTVMLTANPTNAASTALFANGANTAALVWSDSAGTAHSNAWSFSVVDHAVLPMNLWSALGSGSNPGYRMKVFQANSTNIVNLWRNVVQMANQALEGFYAINLADTSMMTNNGYMWMEGADAVVNFAQNNVGSLVGAGNFNTTDVLFPGLPGLDVFNQTGSTTPMDNDAAEFKTYLEFPTAGVYYMAVSSDDGFRVTCAEAQTRKSMLSVVAPASIAGDLPAMMTQRGLDASAFGGLLPTTPIVAQAVIADPVLGTPDGTAPPNNAAALAGKIVIIQRGSYNFTVKCKLAQDAGAVAVIIANNAANATLDPGTMAGDDATITIPCLFVKYGDGTNLIAHGTTDATSPLMLSIGDDGSVKLGEANYGKGASDVSFAFTVPQAGVYPFRLAWENGGGDANCEWFTYNAATGERTLVNDVAAGGVKAYITRTAPVIPTLSVSKDGGVWKISYTGVLRASSTVNGTYDIVAGASSPYTIPTGAAGAMFYRASN